MKILNKSFRYQYNCSLQNIPLHFKFYQKKLLTSIIFSIIIYHQFISFQPFLSLYDIHDYFAYHIILKIIILIMRTNTEQMLKNSYATIQNSPQKEEWAIINKYKAMEFQRMKAKEREIDRIKKESFRRQLDNQLNSRTNAEQRQKEEDKLYYQHLSQKALMQKQREEQEKFQRFMKRKMHDEQNIQKIEAGRSSRINDYDTGYHLEIGMQSQKQHKQKSQHFKKEMLDTLDLQLKEKTQEMKKNKLKNQQAEELHKQIQQNYFKPAERKNYTQNQKIYEYYNQLEQERQYKEKNLEQKMIDQVYERSLKAQDQRAKLQGAKKAQDKERVKEMLSHQIREHSKKRGFENKVNPEEASYQFISNMFRPKQQTYNKEIYKQELLRQAEEQRLKKQMENHMSEEEYRINMNQLSKAVVGSYAQNNYLDRSMGAIGDHKKFQLDNLQYDGKDKDADIIKKRLQSLKARGTVSFIESRQN